MLAARTSHAFRLLSFLGLAVALGGCGLFSPDESTDVEGPTLEYLEPNTPDNLINNFVVAYNKLDWPRYRDMRHEDFLFEFSQEDIDLAGTPDGTWDVFRDGDATQKMFESQPGKDDQIITAITLTLNAVTPTWTDQVEAELAGSLRKRYSVSMRVSFSGADEVEVRGEQDFYVVLVSEGGVDRYQLRYWRDNGVGEL